MDVHESRPDTTAQAAVDHDELKRIYEKQKAHRWTMAQTTADERIRRLKRLREALLERRAELHEVLHADFGKNPGEADLTEVFPVIAELNHSIKHLKQWMKPVRVGTPAVLLGTFSEVRYEPKGLVLILSPWNYPVNLLFNPLVASIAAGNCAVLKPSSKVPHTADFMKDLFERIFPEEEVAVFNGSSAVSNALLDFKWDHIFFTGSPRIGASVMKAAARNLTPVTLELGGKSPVIVDETADLRRTAERLMWGKYLNAGQTCVAPDYLMIHESKRDEFLKECVKVLEQRFGHDSTARKQSDSFCRLVSHGAQKGLKLVLDASVEQGARIAFGGDSDHEQRYLEPTILIDVTEDSPIMQEEIFGPILPVMTFRDLSDPIRIIQGKEKPLALYMFSESKANIDRVMSQTTSGGACINSLIIHLANPDLPFGGVGQSGMGNYHGIYGFRNLSHERAVLRQTKLDTLQMFYPPYTDTVKKMIWLATRFMT